MSLSLDSRSSASMADRKQTREVITILSLCILWYLVSGTNNVIGKMLLSDFPYPITVTMVQLLSITVYSGPFLRLWGVRKYVDISWSYFFKLIIPLAFGKFFASAFSHLSLWKVPVSYAHTVKATMPLFTVVLSRIIMGQKQTLKVYLSLIPIITGVAIASLTEISFDLIGLLSALASTMGFSLQNIFSKKVLHDTGIHHLRLLHLLGRISLFLFIPVWLFIDAGNVIKDPALTSGEYKVIALLLTDGVLNWLQNIIAFSVISLVTPLTYAVASNSKRIFVISVSLLVLGNPVTWLNIFGMITAVFGVLCYQKAKYDQRKVEKTKTLLPFSQQNWQKNTGYSVLPSNGFINNNDHRNSNNLHHQQQNGYANATLNGSANHSRDEDSVSNNSSGYVLEMDI